MSNKEELGGVRETAVTFLKIRAKHMIDRGNRMLALASQLEQIEKSATEGCDGDSRHPYLGVGSDAEEMLWEMAVSYVNRH